MNLIELKLSVKRNTWRMFDHGSDKHDQSFSAVRHKVLERDDHTCRFCGFRSKPNRNGASWQEVHHLNDDHSDNRMENLVTACPLCHQCFHIGLAGIKKRGILIWMPEISQVDLNHLARIMAVVSYLKENHGDEYSLYFDTLQSIFVLFEERKEIMEKMFGEGSSDPTLFGQAMIDASLKLKRNIDAPNGIRLLPKMECFDKQVAYWSEMFMENIPPSSWERIYDKFQNAISK